jgi:prophage regulatory protein
VPIKVSRYPELKTKFGIYFSNVHLLRLEKAGKFPKRVRIGDSAVAWVDSEIDAWLKQRMAERK